MLLKRTTLLSYFLFLLPRFLFSLFTCVPKWSEGLGREVGAMANVGVAGGFLLLIFLSGLTPIRFWDLLLLKSCGLASSNSIIIIRWRFLSSVNDSCWQLEVNNDWCHSGLVPPHVNRRLLLRWLVRGSLSREQWRPLWSGKSPFWLHWHEGTLAQSLRGLMLSAKHFYALKCICLLSSVDFVIPVVCFFLL